ncbi:MAG: hypothetical protein COB85_07910 [Bacteroidetes bacterium]|nr:MAG: hypothetical protein COB85_07910 [Bacteroidota bacterium]
MLFSLNAESIEGPVSVTQKAPNTVLSGEAFVITLTVKKQGTESFAKIQQQLPKGFTAVSVESQNAKFSFLEQTVKFIWDKLPEENEFSVSYKIMVEPFMVGLIKIGGVFAFVSNEDRVLVEIGAIEIDIQPADLGIEEVAENETASIANKEKADDNKTTIAENIVVSPVKESKAPAPSSIKKDSKSYTYKIQVAAAYGPIEIPFLSRKYGIAEPINEEMHNKMNKYTVGSFKKYSEAKNHLSKVKNTYNVQGAFITAYLEKLRIPVNQTFK